MLSAITSFNLSLSFDIWHLLLIFDILQNRNVNMSTIWGLLLDKAYSDNLFLCDDFMNYSFNILGYIIQLLFIELPLDRLQCHEQVSKNRQQNKTISWTQIIIIRQMKQNLSGGLLSICSERCQTWDHNDLYKKNGLE